MKINLPVSQREIPFPAGKILVSKTDLKGTITYASDAFVELSGYTREELIGKNHNLVRHPDMPPQAFAWLWETVKTGHPWRGIVKNRSKNGDHYWVDAFVVPVRQDGATVGYMSVRSVPSRQQVSEAEALYKKLNESKAPIKAGGEFFQRLSVKARLLLIMAFMALMMAGGAIIGVGGVYVTNNALNEAYQEHLKPSLAVARMVQFMGDNRTQVMLALQHNPDNPYAGMHDHPVTMHLDASLKNREQIEQARAEYQKHQINGEEKVLADAFFQARDTFSTEGTAPARDALKAGDYDKANVLLLKKMNPLYKDVMAKADALQQYLATSGEKDFTASQQRYETIRLVGIGGTLAGLLVVVVLGMLLVRSIVRPIQTAIGHFERIAEGKLTNDIAISGRDEVGELLNGLAGMQVHLKVMLDQIMQSANAIEGGCQQLNSQMFEVVEHSDQQRDKVMQVSAAMEEVSQSVSEVADSAEQTANAAVSSQSIVSNSTSQMAQSMDATSRVVEAVQSSSGTITDLNQAIQRIGEITQTIKDIADQTNLLALNAAIEAARAGEQGRGFAVVADEVRKLAERTTNSTADISQTVHDIQNATHTAVQSMDQAVKEVEDGIGLLQASGSSLKEITATSNQVTDMSQHIAAAAKQQSVATDEVARNMEQISSLIENNTGAAQQPWRATEDLATTAEELRELVRYFEVVKK